MTDTMELGLAALAPDVPVIFVGPPGVGKTARVHAWAEAHGYDVIVEHPVIAQSVDYRGLPAVVGDHAAWLPLGALRDLCKPAERPRVLFFDDVGQAAPPVQAALMQIVLARRIGEHALAGDVMIALASNRAEDRSGARPLLAALDNRLLRIDVGASSEAWADWLLTQPDVDHMAAGYVRFRPDCFAGSVPDKPGPFCTPRSLHMAARLAKRGHRHSGVLAGCIGAAAGADLAAWLAVADKLPSVDVLLTDKRAVTKEMQKDPGLMHAIVILAGRQADREPAGVVALADRLGGAWGMALVSTACGLHPGFKGTKAFQAWAAAHKELL